MTFFPPLPPSTFNQDERRQWLAEQTISPDKIIGRGDAATVIAASSTSTDPGKAHHMATGTDDHETWQAALDDLPTAGGTIIFLEGTYNLAGNVHFPDKPVVLIAMGKATLNIASGTTFTWAGNDCDVVFDGFTLTGGVAGMTLMTPRGKFRFVNNTVKDFTVRRFFLIGGLGHLTRAFIKDNTFDTVSIETTGSDFNQLGIVHQTSNGGVMTIFGDNTFKDITHTTHTGASYFLSYSFGDGDSMLVATGNVIDDSTTLTGYFGGDTELVSHNIVDGLMVEGTHSGITDADAIHDNVAAEISAITQKASPVSADHLLIEDSEASNVKKRVTVGSVAASGLAGYTFGGSVYYTSSGSFAKADHSGLKAVRVRVQAGGGAGGGADATGSAGVSAGGGGGGGGYAEAFVLASALATSETVTVGAGGTGADGAPGNTGGTSSFGTHASADGGTGGNDVVSATANAHDFAAGGKGGLGTAGDFLAGGSGAGTGIIAKQLTNVATGGPGGGSALGGGGRSRYSATSGFVGYVGENYGGGGSGAANSVSQTVKAGGAGAPGIVIVDLYF